MTMQTMIGREVEYVAGCGAGCIGGRGMIVKEYPGTGRGLVRLSGLCAGGRGAVADACDVILFDGRTLHQVHPTSPEVRGIGVKLLETVYSMQEVEAIKVRAAEYQAASELAAIIERERRIAFEAARVIARAPLFYWNGIKDDKAAKLQPCFYCWASCNDKNGAIHIHGRNYKDFSKLVNQCFTVHNDSESQTDYFQDDLIRVLPVHPLYPQVKAAMEAAEAHIERRRAKRDGRLA